MNSCSTTRQIRSAHTPSHHRSGFGGSIRTTACIQCTRKKAERLGKTSDWGWPCTSARSVSTRAHDANPYRFSPPQPPFPMLPINSSTTGSQCSCMGLTWVLSTFRRTETTRIADFEAQTESRGVPLRTYGPYHSGYGRLGGFPNLPPLLVRLRKDILSGFCA